MDDDLIDMLNKKNRKIVLRLSITRKTQTLQSVFFVVMSPLTMVRMLGFIA